DRQGCHPYYILSGKIALAEKHNVSLPVPRDEHAVICPDYNDRSCWMHSFGPDNWISIRGHSYSLSQVLHPRIKVTDAQAFLDYNKATGVISPDASGKRNNPM